MAQQSYLAAKAFHLLGLILWIGPSTGGYVLFLLARRQGAEAWAWIFKNYFLLVHLEAAGLAILISSGLIMRSIAPGLKRTGWLRKKLVIVFAVFAPLEAAQLILYHLSMKKALATGEGLTTALGLFDRFSIFSAITLLVTIPAVFYFAVFRPGDNSNH